MRSTFTNHAYAKLSVLEMRLEGGEDSESDLMLNGYIPVMFTFIMGNGLQQAIRAIFKY